MAASSWIVQGDEGHVARNVGRGGVGKRWPTRAGQCRAIWTQRISRLPRNKPGAKIACFTLPDYTVFAPEITMANVNLSRMTVEALMDLRKRVDEMLLEHRAELEKQLERIAVVGGARGGG